MVCLTLLSFLICVQMSAVLNLSHERSFGRNTNQLLPEVVLFPPLVPIPSVLRVVRELVRVLSFLPSRVTVDVCRDSRFQVQSFLLPPRSYIFFLVLVPL